MNVQPVVLQTSARRNGIPIDSLVFEHGIVNLEQREINGPPKEGVYVKGLFLEGACVHAQCPSLMRQRGAHVCRHPASRIGVQSACQTSAQLALPCCE